MDSRKKPRPLAYEPTPEQIAESMAKIRAGWSDDERAKRAEQAGAAVPASVTSPHFAIGSNGVAHEVFGD